jgi:UPF0755 protein
MGNEHKYVSLKDWIAFFVTTTLIFLSSVLLVIATAIFACLRFARRSPALAIGFILVLVLLFFVINWAFVPIDWRAQADSVHVVIEPGDSMNRVVEKLKDAKLIEGGIGLLTLARILGKDRHIQAGRYDFERGLTLYSVFKKLTEADVTLSEVTIPEGLTLRQIAGILKRDIQIDSADFVRLAEDRQFSNSLGIPGSNLEGYLFPDTYRFSWRTSSEEAAKTLVEQFWKIFTDSLPKRADEIGFSLTQVVTLASMIEAEARDGGERDLISAVYHNRLKRGMLLQCDPTVIYALPDLDRQLLLKDLDVDSPYNTYKHPGLPPGPICNPGRASIVAALYPADADYLYFVARGDGSHVFSRTLRQHNNAKLRIKQGRDNR